MKLPSPRSLILWMLFFGFDLILAAAVCEIWIRGFIPVKNICYQTDPRLGVTFCPNQRTYGYVEPGYSNILITNSAGFHDVERSTIKPPGTYRVEVYGDSMVQGYVVPIENTLIASLERNLNSKGLPVRIEVLNMGSGDDGTASQIATFQEIGIKYEPDMVLCYFMDDFGDNLPEIHRREWSPYYALGDNGKLELIPAVPKDITNPWERFKKASMFYRLMANKLLESKFYANFQKTLNEVAVKFQSGDKTDDKSYRQTQQEICIRKGWPLTLRLFEKFNEIVTEENGNFVVVDGRTFSPEGVGTVYSNEDMESACESVGIRYIPNYRLHEKLMNSEDKSAYLFLDNHPRASGYELLSRGLSENIARLIRKDLGTIAEKATSADSTM